ncbi:hypothetical protein V6N12_009355 [Hibiscus sabdariffa]|uniref:Uncharacterized protein n=1 Tax=Hibiscus sabdariffa TaxID=183260 RepID=A0ABR2E8W0_9ROSI
MVGENQTLTYRKVDRLQVDPDRLCYWDIIRNVSAFGGRVDLYVACLEEVDTVNGGNAVVGNNFARSSYDHVVGEEQVDVGSQVEDCGLDAEKGPEHVEVEPEGEDVGPKLAENEPQIGDNESSDDNGLEHVEVLKMGHNMLKIGQILIMGWTMLMLGHKLMMLSQSLVMTGQSLKMMRLLMIMDIGSDADEEVKDIRKKGRGKRHKEKVADHEQVADREGQPVQPDNVDEGNRSSDKDGKLEGYETDYISSSDPGEYEDSEQSDDDVPRVRQSLLPRYDPNCVIPVWELGLSFDDNE